MATPSDRLERILVLLDGQASEAALEAAAEIARRRHAQLVGLFVEDSDLLTASQLPFAREIGLVSGVSRPLAADDVRRRMAERAAFLRDLLVRVARRRGVEAVLEVGRGRQAQAVLARVRPADLLVIRRGEWAQRPGSLLELVLAEVNCAVMIVSRAEYAPAHAPMVLMDGSDGAARALSQALALARGETRAVTFLVAPDQGAGDSRAQVTELLRGQGIEARFVDLERLDRASVRAALRHERPPVLLVSRESPLFATPEGLHLDDFDELPLVLVP